MTINEINCMPQGLSLFTMMRSYLYPLVIQYSLIAASILHQILSNIGAIVNPAYQQFVKQQASSSQVDYNMECHKASMGMFIGLLIFVTMFSVVLAFTVDTREFVIDGYLVLGSELALQGISLLICLTAIYKLRHLDTTNNIDYYFCNEKPLICGLAGLYFLQGANIMAASDVLNNERDCNSCILYIVGNITSFLQASVQTLFIVHGYRLEATTLRQQHEKPGRAYISILIFCNFSLWLISSFQLRKSDHSLILTSFFGQRTWTILLYLVLPFAVFYRFQSVVGLSHIWIEVYKKKCLAVIRIHPEQIATHFLYENKASENACAGKRDITVSNDKADIDLEKSESNGIVNTKRETYSLYNKLDIDIETNENSAVKNTNL